MRRDGSDAAEVLTVQEWMSLLDDELKDGLALVRVAEDMSSSPMATWNDNAAIPVVGDTALAIGFGDESFEDYYYDDNDILEQVQLAILDSADDRCMDTFDPLLDADKLICAGGEIGRSTCFGDLGSPLLLNGEIVGVTRYSPNCFFDGTVLSSVRVVWVHTYTLYECSRSHSSAVYQGQ